MAFRTSKRNSSSQSETSDPLMFKLYRPSFQLKTTSSSSLQTKIHILKSNSSEKECSEPQWESSPWPSRIPVGRSNRWAMGNSWWARSYTRFLSFSENQGLVVGTMRYFRATTFVYTTKKEKSKLLSLRLILLFAVDRDTLEYFCRLQSNVFDAASLFQTNHVVHWNAPREGIFSVRRHDFFVLRYVHSQRVYLAYRTFCV